MAKSTEIISLVYLFHIFYNFGSCSVLPTIEIICPGNIQPGSISAFPFTGPAVDVVVMELQKTYHGQFNIVLTLLFNKSFSTPEDLVSGTDNLLSLYYLKQRSPANATVFIYPGSSESIGIVRLAAGWRQFVMIGSFNDVLLRNKALYPNVVQASPLMLRPMIQTYFNFISRFKWTTVYVICDLASGIGAFNNDASRTLVNKLKATPGTTVYYMFLNTAKNDTFDRILRDVQRVARIISFWGHATILRRLMIAASEANMTNGDYVYIAIAPFEYPTIAFGNVSWQNYDRNDEVALAAYRCIYVVTPTQAGPVSQRNRALLFPELIKRSRRDYNYTYKEKDLPSPVVLSSYANFHIFGKVIAEILAVNQSADLSSTTFIASRIYNRSFVTPIGDIHFDEVGDRIVQFDVQQLNTSTGLFYSALRQDIHTLELVAIENIEIVWLLGHVPPDVPECGFSGVSGSCSLLPGQKTFLTLSISVVVPILVVLLSGCLIFRKLVSEIQLNNHSWDLKGAVVLSSSDHTDSKAILLTTPNIGATPVKYLFASSQLAVYDSQQVIATVVSSPCEITMRLSRSFLRLAKAVYEMHHANVNRFMGIVRQQKQIYFLFEHNQRGSLDKMIGSQTNSLDWDAKLGLIDDLLQGIKSIHQDSQLKFHGNLYCETCLISKHFALKITDLGVPRLLNEGFGITFPNQQRVPLTDPRLTNVSNIKAVFGTASDDIYSFGVICLEIASDCTIGPSGSVSSFGNKGFRSRKLIVVSHYSRTSAVVDMVTRINGTELPVNFKSMLVKCVASDAAHRASLKQLLMAFGSHVRHGGFVEKLLNRLSNYANDLEEAVFQRTQELLLERQKCDTLLQRMLPAVIIDRLRRMENVEPEEFSCVTIQFSDIVGFVEFVSQSSAVNVFSFLNSSHGIFDHAITSHDVYKVETIADSYVIASGLPVRNGAKHAKEICNTGLCFQKLFKNSTFTDLEMCLRIGIHSGPCVAAVVGIRNPRYCVFGDTMNTASRMESHGEGLKIHLSPTTQELISQVPELRCVPRGPVAIKGKGLVSTFWLENGVSGAVT